MAKLENVEGIGVIYAGQLRKAGVRSTRSLLNKGATARGRDGIARASGISSALILEWVNHVDLFRIKGVGEEYSDLLEEAGVDTVMELSQRNPANLYETILETNTQKRLVRRPPSKKMVRDWVENAKRLPRKVYY